MCISAKILPQREPGGRIHQTPTGPVRTPGDTPYRAQAKLRERHAPCRLQSIRLGGLYGDEQFVVLAVIQRMRQQRPHVAARYH